MELRTLRYFTAVAEAGSVSAAAERVHVTQPAISRQLRELERDLGVDLFNRSVGRLRLSAAGREFLPHAQDVLRRAESARAAARSYAAGRLERITIAAPTTTLSDVIAPFLATLDDDDPMPTVFESDPREAYIALRHGADLAIVTEAPQAALARLPIASLPIWAYVRGDHAWRSRASISLDELASDTVLALAPTFKPRQILDGALLRSGVAPDRLVDCSTPQVAQALAAAGRGVAVVSDDARFDLHGVQLIGRDGPLRIDLYAAWEHDHHASATLQQLAARVQVFCLERYGSDVALVGEGAS